MHINACLCASAVCCSVLRCVAEWISVVQCAADLYIMLQCAAGNALLMPSTRALSAHSSLPLLDGYCSTVQGLLDWFEVDLGFTELLFIQINLCVMCFFVFFTHSHLKHSRTNHAGSCVYMHSLRARTRTRMHCAVCPRHAHRRSV